MTSQGSGSGLSGLISGGGERQQVTILTPSASPSCLYSRVGGQGPESFSHLPNAPQHLVWRAGSWGAWQVGSGGGQGPLPLLTPFRARASPMTAGPCVWALPCGPGRERRSWEGPSVQCFPCKVPRQGEVPVRKEGPPWSCCSWLSRHRWDTQDQRCPLPCQARPSGPGLTSAGGPGRMARPA